MEEQKKALRKRVKKLEQRIRKLESEAVETNRILRKDRDSLYEERGGGKREHWTPHNFNCRDE